ncbi:MAG: PEP-CTERM sorting domain-containing protein [Bryobacteraceae bacterium]
MKSTGTFCILVTYMRISPLSRVVVCLPILMLAAMCAQAGTVFIQPIHVCDGAGANCGNSSETLFEAEGDKIWAQAGISIFFLPWTSFNSTSFQNLDENIGSTTSLQALVNTPGNGANPNALVLDFWFVTSIIAPGGGSAFGEAFLGDNGAAIADIVFSAGRIDTIYHELGHNLGLPHPDESAPGCTTFVQTQLMASGGCRTVPSNISQITPSGTLDVLAAGEIATAQASPFDQAVPEPATFGLLGAALLGVFAVRRRAA